MSTTTQRSRILCAFVALFSCRSLMGQCDLLRFPGTEYRLQDNSIAGVGFGDFNGDGRTDFVHRNDQRLVIRLADPHGDLRQVSQSIDSGAYFSLEVGNLDRDGDLDLVVVKRLERIVEQYTNDGEGFFNHANTLEFADAPRRALLADLDGDHDSDMIVQLESATPLRFYQNTGQGRFNEIDADIPEYSQFIIVATGDVVGTPGRLTDLVIYDRVTGILDILQNRGRFRFSKFQSFEINYVNSYPPPLVADFDSDGDFDIGLLQTFDFSILLNDNNAGFLKDIQSLQELIAFPYFRPRPSFAMARDLDGDGDVDLAVGAEQGLSIYSSRANDSIGVPFADLFERTHFFPSGHDYDTYFSLGDFNGNSRWDAMIFPNHSRSISMHLDFAASSPPSLNLLRSDIRGNDGVLLEDFDRDGNLDLASFDYLEGPDSNVHVLFGQEGGHMDEPRFYSGILSPVAIASGDLDEDGYPDLVLAGSVPIVMMNLHDRTFDTKLISFFVPGTEHFVDVADLNGDDHLDIVATYWETDLIAVFPGNGDGTFRRPTSFNTDDGPNSVDAADLDGDGDVDLAVGCALSRSVAVHLNLYGLGLFSNYTSYPMYGSGNGPQMVKLGDLNEDGAMDLVASNYSPGNGNVAMLINDGIGHFDDILSIEGFRGPHGLDLGDLNQDGHLDIVVTNATGYAISLLLGAGDGSIFKRQDMTSMRGAYRVAIGDMNRDGLEDIVTNDNKFLIIRYQQECDSDQSDADLNDDGLVNVADLLLLLTAFGPCPVDGTPCQADLDGDGRIDIRDLLLLLQSGNFAPGNSGGHRP